MCQESPLAVSANNILHDTRITLGGSAAARSAKLLKMQIASLDWL
jgi:hypothetical protein